MSDMSELGEALDAAYVSPAEFSEAVDAARGGGRAVVTVADLAAGFDAAVQSEADPARQGKLRTAAQALRALGREFVVDVTAEIAVRRLGL